VRLLLALLPALALLAGTAATARADPASPAYAEAVQRAYDLVNGAPISQTWQADEAIRVLRDGTGGTQPEIIDDLKARPPLYADATARLATLLDALGRPVTTADPAAAQQRLQDVLASGRYDPLRRPPTPLERFAQWVQDRISDLLRLLFGPRGGAQAGTDLWLYLVAIAVVAVTIFMVARTARGRFSGSMSLAPDGPRPPADFFVEADRLAAQGDRVGAIRALCAGVAATLAGEGSWQGSPLTVREIFRRAPDFASLRPLLLPFEAAVYGGRGVDRATYERAAQVAAAFRPDAEKAA
jgi:hypothetical protein